MLIEELLQQQGLTLEEAVMKPPLFEASRQPLQGTIDQLLKRDRAAQSKETLRYIEVSGYESTSFIKNLVREMGD